MWVWCVAGTGDQRGDYMLCLGPGSMVRDTAETGGVGVYVWDSHGKHLVSVEYEDLVRAEMAAWAAKAYQARIDVQADVMADTP